MDMIFRNRLNCPKSFRIIKSAQPNTNVYRIASYLMDEKRFLMCHWQDATEEHALSNAVDFHEREGFDKKECEKSYQNSICGVFLAIVSLCVCVRSSLECQGMQPV